MKKHPILTFILFLSVLFIAAIGVMALAMSVSTGKTPSFSKKPVAIVMVEGPIFDSLDVLKELEELRVNDKIKAVVLRLDSPGGAVAPSQEIFEQVLKLKKEKPVVVSMGSMAASGAYYIACGADKIVANPGSVTGSIGVILKSFGLQEVIKKLFVESRVIKSGSHKDVGDPFKDLTEEDRSYLQNITDNIYGQFTKAVAQHRNLDIANAHTFAEGKIFTGEQAKEIGLVDTLGNIYVAIDEAKKMASLPNDAGVKWPKEPTPFEQFFQGNHAKSILDFVMQKYQILQLPLFMLGINEETT
ncbi:MAG: signal peptide peptidase SppA [bacterium]|nr:signal peptide peptidase SppA [bacterium]